eukprot:CAMPEP_0182431202 /NCGR_PEP_ID=MMETSP1167-20130531/47219_1 /TAXON_ID=2988 /ORGANISM="Mallomonas Sp, Strain CCMP3275" /LENGTH=47 /DNA_ID= /DNA_START= /DNA_END= /DNA_ORIENTATION=
MKTADSQDLSNTYFNNYGPLEPDVSAAPAATTTNADVEESFTDIYNL